MSKHTPRPWFVRTIDESIGSVDSENGVMVAQAQQVSSKDQLSGSVERKANAQLIAAAPDLLDALKTMLNFGNLGAYERADAVMAAKAAINKATGE